MTPKHRYGVVIETDEADIAEFVKALRERCAGYAALVSVEPRQRALGFPKDHGVSLRRDFGGETVEGEPRNVTVTCDPCSASDCASCKYPLICPCSNPSHNFADFANLTVERIAI